MPPSKAYALSSISLGFGRQFHRLIVAFPPVEIFAVLNVRNSSETVTCGDSSESCSWPFSAPPLPGMPRGMT